MNIKMNVKLYFVVWAHMFQRHIPYGFKWTKHTTKWHVSIFIFHNYDYLRLTKFYRKLVLRQMSVCAIDICYFDTYWRSSGNLLNIFSKNSFHNKFIHSQSRTKCAMVGSYTMDVLHSSSLCHRARNGRFLELPKFGFLHFYFSHLIFSWYLCQMEFSACEHFISSLKIFF